MNWIEVTVVSRSESFNWSQGVCANASVQAKTRTKSAYSLDIEVFSPGLVGIGLADRNHIAKREKAGKVVHDVSFGTWMPLQNRVDP
jgi:hypothetical protein